jgi:hypothetical protein
MAYGSSWGFCIRNVRSRHGAEGLRGVRRWASRNVCVDRRDADVVDVAEFAGAKALRQTQAEAGHFRCQLGFDVRSPSRFDQAKRFYESRFDGGLLYQNAPPQMKKETSRRFFCGRQQRDLFIYPPPSRLRPGWISIYVASRVGRLRRSLSRRARQSSCETPYGLAIEPKRRRFWGARRLLGVALLGFPRCCGVFPGCGVFPCCGFFPLRVASSGCPLECGSFSVFSWERADIGIAFGKRWSFRGCGWRAAVLGDSPFWKLLPWGVGSQGGIWPVRNRRPLSTTVRSSRKLQQNLSQSAPNLPPFISAPQIPVQPLRARCRFPW